VQFDLGKQAFSLGTRESSFQANPSNVLVVDVRVGSWHARNTRPILRVLNGRSQTRWWCGYCGRCQLTRPHEVSETIDLDLLVPRHAAFVARHLNHAGTLPASERRSWDPKCTSCFGAIHNASLSISCVIGKPRARAVHTRAHARARVEHG